MQYTSNDNIFTLKQYAVIASTNPSSDLLYETYDEARAREIYNAADHNDFEGYNYGTAVLQVRDKKYKLIEENLEDFPFEDYYDDETTYELLDESDYEDIETREVARPNEQSDKLLSEVQLYVKTKYGGGKYSAISVFEEAPADPDFPEILGAIQLRIADHSENVNNNDRFGGSDFYLSVVIADVDATSGKFSQSMYDRRRNEKEIYFTSDDQFDGVIEEIEDEIQQAREYIWDKSKKYAKGGRMKTIKHGTITHGPSHAEGGIKVFNKSTETILEVEGGEGVVNKKSMASSRKVKLNGQELSICEAVSKLNEMEGGVRFDCDKVEDRRYLSRLMRGGKLEKGERTDQEYKEYLESVFAERPVTKMKKGGTTPVYSLESFGLKKKFKGTVEDQFEQLKKKSLNFCEAQPELCQSSLDIQRKDMPQIYEDSIPEYVDYLSENGIETTYARGVSVDQLKPTQKDISLERMERMYKRLINGLYTDDSGKLLNPLKRTVLATKDGYLLDGHHRWALNIFLHPKNQVDVLYINADIDNLVEVSKRFQNVSFETFEFGGRINAQTRKSYKYKSSLLDKSIEVMPLWANLKGQFSTTQNGFTVKIAKSYFATNNRFQLLQILKSVFPFSSYDIQPDGPNVYTATLAYVAGRPSLDRNGRVIVTEIAKSFVISVIFYPQGIKAGDADNIDFLESVLKAIEQSTDSGQKIIRQGQQAAVNQTTQSQQAPQTSTSNKGLQPNGNKLYDYFPLKFNQELFIPITLIDNFTNPKPSEYFGMTVKLPSSISEATYQDIELQLVNKLFRRFYIKALSVAEYNNGTNSFGNELFWLVKKGSLGTCFIVK
jgi:hypothetical protein